MIIRPSLGELVQHYRPASCTKRSRRYLLEHIPTGREIVAMAHLEEGEMALNEPAQGIVGTIYGTKRTVTGVNIFFHNHPRGDSHPSWADAKSARRAGKRYDVIGSIRGGIAQVRYNFGISGDYVSIDAITSNQPVRKVAMKSDEEWRQQDIRYRSPIRLEGLPLPEGREKLEGVYDITIVPPTHFLGKYRQERFHQFFGQDAVDWATIFGRRPTHHGYALSQTQQPRPSLQPQT